MTLIGRAEAFGGLTETEARDFVAEALKTFRWHSEATVDAATYDRLVAAHRLIADVVSFKGPHINHLTPRTLDIDAVQAAMPERGITPKAVIEGPPRRNAEILLRQTSFKALEEPVVFQGVPGTHLARFGEIEQRGVALTPKGRALYDAMLSKARTDAATWPLRTGAGGGLRGVSRRSGGAAPGGAWVLPVSRGTGCDHARGVSRCRENGVRSDCLGRAGR